MKTINLKPCPFCGSSDVIAIEYYDGFSVMCSNCEIQTSREYSKTLAIEKWNTRHESGELPGWVKTELMNAVCCAKDDETKGWNDAIAYILSLKKPEDE